MMHVITADGCAWIAATAIIGVQRSGAEYAIVNLQDGKVIASFERYDSFVERLNNAWLRAAGVEPTWEPPEAVGRRSAPTSIATGQEEAVSVIGLDPVFP